MLVWLTLPFYDFCGFRSVAVNSVYKLQFFYIYAIDIRRLSRSPTCDRPGRTNGRTDGRTDGRMMTASYRDSIASCG